MAIQIIAFGQIAEITGSKLELAAVDIDELQLELIKKFPELKVKKYALAVNKKIVTHNLTLAANDIVALMPPYSGG